MTNVTAELNLTSSVGNSTGEEEERDREYYDLDIDSSEAAGPATSTSDSSLPLATIILIIVFIYSLLVLVFISGKVSWCLLLIISLISKIEVNPYLNVVCSVKVPPVG